MYGLETELAVVGERDKHSKPLYLRDNLTKLHHWFMLQTGKRPALNTPSSHKRTIQEHVSVSKLQCFPYIHLLMMGYHKLIFFYIFGAAHSPSLIKTHHNRVSEFQIRDQLVKLSSADALLMVLCLLSRRKTHLY